MLNNEVRLRLCQVVTRYGHSICNDPRKVKGLLMDLCGQHRQEVKLLVGALDERVASDLLLSTSPLHLIAARLVVRLQDELSVTEAAALWAVESWAVALGLTIPPAESPVPHIESAPVVPSSLLLPAPPVPIPPPIVHSYPITIRTRTEINPKDGAEAILIPAGSFLMGDDGQPDNPRRTVTLDAYYIYMNLVTVAQYKKFCHETGREMLDYPPVWGWKDDHPVVRVWWDDANRHCDWAGAQLPTEAQWEKAARGTDGRQFPWGNEFASHCLWYSKQRPGDAGSTAAVGSFPLGASPYGCLDMAGNAWQWCADWYDKEYMRRAPVSNPAGPRFGKSRVLRGGSWFLHDESFFHCANRFAVARDYKPNLLGFRCVVRAGTFGTSSAAPRR